MTTSTSHYLCSVADIGPKGKEVCIRRGAGDEYIMLLRSGDGIRAYHNVCPHHGLPLNWAPDEFLFGPQNSVVCSHHAARFDIDTGECLGGACRGVPLKAVRIRMEGDAVWMEDDDPQPSPQPELNQKSG